MNSTKEENFSKLKEGMVVSGKVKNIRPFGVFVELDCGITGFLRIDDISISRMKNPGERFKIGQNIKTMIKFIDKEENKINLTYKELLGDWEDNIKMFEERTITKGIVKGADKFKNGLFIELTPNLVGMAEYKEGYEYGQKVDVFIKKINKDKKKIKLNII